MDDWNGKGDIVDPQIISFLKWLIGRHIHSAQKIGCGIAAFYVGPDDRGGRCLHLRRIDGTTTDFGVSSCLNDVRQLNMKSFRTVAELQIKEYRVKRVQGWTFISEFSGQVFPTSQLHIDHVIPFETIVEQFAEQEGLDLNQMLTQSQDMTFVPLWIDPQLPKRFAQFHSRFPLRAVSQMENLSTLKKKSKVSVEQA
jgi:hypothetical protein